jgi:hypothetical protein
MSEFVWTDELVREFIEYGRRLMHISDLDYLGMDMDKFKASKQPKPEWEILKGQSDARGVHTWRKIDEANEHPCPLSACRIYSVRRLSDGEVFTSGDIVAIEGTFFHGPILGFYMAEGSKIRIKTHNSMVSADLSQLTRQLPTAVYLTPSQIEKLKQLLK